MNRRFWSGLRPALTAYTYGILGICWLLFAMTTARAQDDMMLADLDFENGRMPDVMEVTEGWMVTVEDGAGILKTEPVEYEFASIPSGIAWDDYALEIRVNLTRGGLSLDTRLPENFCGGYSATFLADEALFKLYAVDRHCNFHLLDEVNFVFPADEWATVRFEVAGSRLAVLVDDETILETNDDAFTQGFIMLTAYPDSSMVVDWLRVERLSAGSD